MKHKSGLKTASDLNDSHEPVWQALLTAIVEHQLPPGCRLPEEALADAFGISRTGIRQVLQRLAAVQMITLTPRRGAHVASPDAQEARDIFHTRSLIETANLPAVIAHCQPPHLAALNDLLRAEEQARQQPDGPAAIRLSAAFHIQLQAISGNQVLTDLVTRLTQRSSLVIAAWGAPWQQGCRCDHHQQLVDHLRAKRLDRLTDAMRQHFDHILASLRFERGDEVQPDFSRLFARKGVPQK
ncbi:GntR family transcriptional regulator [Mixta sp. Marseille-Q2659]|uniref:GntR family transcriptional regulator n=1 Tax=Mixta sp. Marseille-Q2659 TaxID=2736607 RepID=UPI0023B8B174|nr:GntR family transcriptional regulator [Mixta sp. Marseille-Q2659]